MPKTDKRVDAYIAKAPDIEWIVGAKQDATRERRIAQAVQWMAEGKPRHWKYMKAE